MLASREKRNIAITGDHYNQVVCKIMVNYWSWCYLTEDNKTSIFIIIQCVVVHYSKRSCKKMHHACRESVIWDCIACRLGFNILLYLPCLLWIQKCACVLSVGLAKSA